MENYYTNSILTKSSTLLSIAKGNLLAQIGNGKQQLAGLLLFVFFLLSATANAQYSNVPVTGFNADVVANGATGPAINSTSADVDGANWVFVDTTFNPGSGVCTLTGTGLPGSRLINTTTTSGLSYLLQPYNANNSLRLPGGTSGTLTLTTPISASNIYLLALGGSGAASITATITFTDLTTQTALGTAPDWCSASGAATSQFYRIDRTVSSCTGGVCQYLFDVNLSIDGPNLFKTISSIQISSVGGILNVMAVGARDACAVPSAQATGFTNGTITRDSISASFTAAVPAPIGTGGYLVVRYPQGATPTNPANKTSYITHQAIGLGTVVSFGTGTTFTARALTGGTAYDFYVYTYNINTNCGGPMYNTTAPLMSTVSTSTCSGTLTGTVLIGPGYLNTVASGYTSITNALTEINANGLAGNTILELQPGYDAVVAGETYPITFPVNGCIASNRTLTIRPSSLVTDTFTITSNNAGATINLNGASYITFDGRPGGAGSDKFISIVNTNNAGAAIQFINDAHHNTFTYCDIQGQNTSATSTALSGVVYFATANSNVLLGNDNNTLSFCDVHATVGGFPAMGIVSSGSTTTTSSWNDYNTITDCNIYNYFSASLATTGIKLENGSNAFTINNNHLYQTATRTYTSAVAHRGFWLTPNTASAASPSGFVVTNNFIGGNASNGSGTYTINGSIGVYFWGMDINHFGSVPSSVQGNTITNISVTSTITGSTNDFFRGISTGSTGHVNIGTINGNTIGSGSVARAITLCTTGSLTNSYGIKNASTSSSTDTINIYNNIIGGITDSSTNAVSGSHIYGVAVTTGSFTNIVNNTIGSTTVPNSINSPNASTALQIVMGISVPTGLTNHVSTITGNTIANLNNGYASTSTGYTRGIAVLSSARTIINNNTVSNLTSASQYTGSAALACLIGIIANTSNTMTVSGNTVHSLVLSHASSTAASYVEGIVIGANGTVPTHAISKNVVHSFDVLSPTNNSAVMVGMDILGGSNIFSNNMIRLGIKPDGTDFTSPLLIRGFYLNSTAATNFYHNTIYIGGLNVGATGAKNSMAFHRAAASGAHDIRNNVFVNERSNAVLGGGKHYQLFLGNLVTLTLNSNIYYGTGNDVRFATPNGGTNDSTVYSINWANTGDVGSGTGNPQLNAPNASAALVDLHIHPSNATSVESAGVLIASVTDDKDGDSRATNTPTDVGADAGNFVGVNMVIDSTVVDQNTSTVVSSSTNQVVVGIRMYTKNGGNPLWVTGFDLHTATTSSNLDIENAKVFYTGSRSTFDTTSLFGVLNSIPNGSYIITGSDTLAPGLNYFWVTYDVKSTATPTNVIDARLDAITIVGSPLTNILYSGDPLGSRLIKAPLNGNYDIGTLGAYPTITAAVADLKILGVSGPVSFTLKEVLYSAGLSEVFPITVNGFAGASAVNKVTMFPGTGIVARIEAANATAAIDLNGAKYFVIDGRQDSAGVFTLGTNLQIVNTTGPSVRFINEASYNKLKYVDLKSNNSVVTTAAGAGVVNFGTTTGTNGNDSNTIEYCNIHEESAGFPLIGISSIGSATTVLTNNDGNKIDHCNIYNFFSAGTATAGIYVGANNGSWTITNNHVYQELLRTYTGAVTHRAFWITPNTTTLTSASGFVINDNFIGGSAADGSGTYQMTGTVNYLFHGMDIWVGAGAITSIQNNVITNMDITGAASTSIYGFNIEKGNVECGTIAGNLVGSTTTNGAIVFTTNASGGAILPYRVGGANTVTLKHNIASGINIAGNSPTIAASFFGMNLSGGATVIADSNTIGSKTLANSITLGANTSTTASVALGIIINPGAMTSHTVRYNQISNITNNYSGASTAASVRALHVSPSSTGTVIVTDNIIEQIKNGAISTGVGANAAMQGIIVGAASATSVTISKNTVRSLVLTSATGAVTMNGIYYAGPTTGNHIVSRNMVHSLALSGANPAAIIAGIDIASGNVTVANNMVRLGIDSTGTAMTDACTIKGINKGTNNSRVIFNTVYIGGTGVGSDANRSIAFARTGTGVDTVRNNIFINQRERTNVASGGGHFAVSLNNATTIAMDYNLLASNDSMGLYNSLKQLSLNDWKSASGMDANSISGASGLLNPTGTTATIDLHISAVVPTPIEGSGLVISGLGADVDFDGQDRTTLTPTDMGADAGDFIVNDIAAPSIVYTPLTNTTATTDRIVTATISDVTGVYLTGTLRPRIYFKNMDAGTYVSTQGVLVSGTKTNGTWDFTISESALGGIAGGDSIYYFVIAQDSTPANNVGSFPGGVTATDVNTVTVGPGVPSKYLITPFLSGTYTVGNTVACDFPSLTVAINYIGASVLAGPVILELMDPLYDKTTETFPIVFSPTTGASSTNNITVRPAAGVTALISDSITHTIFDLNGIDYLTIDGRQGGNGTPNSLTIQNRSISNVGYGTVATPVNNANAIRFINDATFNTIKYANLQGASQTNLSGVVFFSIGTTVGNSNNTIQDCNIGNVPSVVLFPNNIFVGLGTATDSTKFNRNVLIKRNNIYNYFSSIGESNAFKISKGNTEWTIDSNHFYQTAVLTGTAGTQYLMNLNRRVGPTVSDDVYAFASLQNMVITNNYVGGSAPYAAGTPWTITGAGPNYAGLYGEYGLYSRARISGNTFTNFEMNQNAAGNRWIGISVANGVANVDSNVIGSTTGLSAITVNSTVNGTGLVGIASSTGGIAGGRTRISYNKMGGITINGNVTTSVNFTGISVTGTGNATQTYLIENNTIGNELANNIVTAGASASGTAQNMVAISSTNPSINTVRNNTIQNLTNTYTGVAASLTHGISLSVGVDTVSGNYISNLTNAAAQTSNVTTNTVSVTGVQLNTASSGNLVSQNTLRNLWNGNIGSANVSVVGINANGVGTTEITNNNIYSAGVTSTSAGANVIGVATNTTSSIRAYNNMVSLGLDTLGADMQNAVTIAGFVKNSTGSFAGLHNTVHIQGAGVGSNLGNTMAFRRSADGVDTLINNIFINMRNNTALGGGHYAVSLNTINTLTSHHNILNILTSPCDTLIGLDGNMGYLSLTDWQTFSGKEANSKDTAMAFVSTSNLHLNPSVYGAFTLVGAPVGGISTDIDGEARVIATPYIGADEITGSPLPVHLLALTATAKSGDVYVVWSTASENNNKGFEVERSIDGKTFEYAGFVKGNNKNSVSNYSFMDARAFVKSNQNTLYYRLKQVDLDGKFTYSNKVKVTEKTTSSNVLAVYPNPFNTDLSMNVFVESNTEMSLTITDVQGRMVATQKATLVKGMNTVNIDAALSLHKGIYFVQTIVNGEVSATKIVKH